MKERERERRKNSRTVYEGFIGIEVKRSNYRMGQHALSHVILFPEKSKTIYPPFSTISFNLSPPPSPFWSTLSHTSLPIFYSVFFLSLPPKPPSFALFCSQPCRPSIRGYKMSFSNPRHQSHQLFEGLCTYIPRFTHVVGKRDEEIGNYEEKMWRRAFGCISDVFIGSSFLFHSI